MSLGVEVIQRGTVPCCECGKPHDAFHEIGSPMWGSWADPKDGHAYQRMSAEQVVAYYQAREAGRLAVDEHGDALRRLADA